MSLNSRPPEYAQRIVCLTDETTETLYLLEEDWRIVGVSGFTVRPERARKEKPIISGFTNARIPEILELQPDLVLGYSDLQASIAAELIAQGVEVHVFNQRTIAGILRMIRTVGALIGCNGKSDALVRRLTHQLRTSKRPKGDAEPNSQRNAHRPRIYFEEWNDPLITGIHWVSELITLAGGTDVFAELADQPLAKNRVIADDNEVARRAPDVIIASWCGKPFHREELLKRPSWQSIPAVQTGHIYEIDSSLILQPGPAALTDGLEELQRIVRNWHHSADA